MARLVLAAGLPGTGKTTLARALAHDLRAAWLRIDAIEAALGVPVRTEGYDVARALAAANLGNGLDVVVDAVCPVPVSRTWWASTAAEAGAAFVVLELYLPDVAEHRRRVSQRLPDLPGQRVPSWDDVAAWDYAPWDERRDGVRTRVDGTDAAAALAVALRAVALRAVY
ncbi:AAA family ATPase [Xylanimonas allomyrinae]|uniref:AAA family ATPase n=1 Tax=Xylanimonas allomyrinae TaxID=2509459 RepID=A0A4P6EJT6_9MICO|nr:AAA family ATPase [Xylanimonas allomyrinae]QAY62842.1 AAA family ATPase [Xylanimonas allomyrinae]